MIMITKVTPTSKIISDYWQILTRANSGHVDTGEPISVTNENILVKFM